MNLQFFGGRGSKSGKTKADTGIRTIEESNIRILDASPESMKKLEELARKGELPESLPSRGEERAKVLEKIDELYPKPQGVLADYDANVSGRNIDILFNNQEAMTYGESALIATGRYKASESERSGAIKYAVYGKRGVLELDSTYRRSGFPTLEMFRKWGGRLLSDKEKAQVNKEINEHVEKLFGSPMSKSGQRYNEVSWIKKDGGWYREGDTAFSGK